MISQGLLVSVGREEFLLTTASLHHVGPEELVVHRRSGSRWVPMAPRQAAASREQLLGALVEFFAGLCRTLNKRTALSPLHRPRRLRVKRA